MVGLSECRKKSRPCCHANDVYSRDWYNDSTGVDDFLIKLLEIGDKPARKMEAKSIMISLRLLADLLDL
ncbi:hypothetical protein C1N50_15650 [Vibrio campbellii]|nr:hypothetical protein C1N50_15650 [Vibrio campbellii]